MGGSDPVTDNERNVYCPPPPSPQFNIPPWEVQRVTPAHSEPPSLTHSSVQDLLALSWHSHARSCTEEPERLHKPIMDPSNCGPPPELAFQPGYPMMNPVNPNPVYGQPQYPPTNVMPVMAPVYYPTVNNAAAVGPPVYPAGAPGAPPFMGNVPGYEGIATGDNGGKFLPPPPDMLPGPAPVPAPGETTWQIPSISNEDAKEALLEYANGECCYGNSPVEEMQIQSLKPFNTYRYRLETFTESRACDWTTTPFTGQNVDSANNGPAPLPWHVPVNNPALFKDEQLKMPVPHTSSIKPCPLCNGVGKTVCQKCHGSRGECKRCNGKGQNSSNETCDQCGGDGKENCKTCNNSNIQKCPTCNGKGQVVSFIELTVTWKNNLSEFIPDPRSEFPISKFEKVNGEKVFCDENMMVPPLVSFPEPSINHASQNCVQEHRTKYFATCRVLKQKQSIEWLPLTKVDYTWKGKPYNYFVYGKEKKVHTDKYAQTCCCVIL
uniref:Protein SSUH2 homolog n=2 Tax=Leptobrachium leishanense TaxID=445787 RepID=A0A8C5PZ87_9ANUR